MTKLIFIFFLLPSSVFAQHLLKIEGRVVDKESRRTIMDATLILPQKVGAITDEKGCFSLTEKPGKLTIIVSHIQYQQQALVLELQKDTLVEIFLEPLTQGLEEVEVAADRNSFVTNVMPGMVSINQEVLSTQPALFGMPDVVTTLQRGTGVQTVSEGVAGIYVRGGDAGQNLIMYDNVELIDPSHLLGTYSAFNPYLVEQVDLYKGNSPVQYAGRLSSATVVSSLNNAENQPTVTANIGTLASTLALTLQKEKWGAVVGARRTQLELYRGLAKEIFPDAEHFLNNNSYYFSDFNGKFFFNNKKHDRLSVAWYLGGDHLNYNADNGLDIDLSWQNKGAALTWKHTQQHFSLQTVVGLTHYNFDFRSHVMDYDADFASRYKAAYFKHTYHRQLQRHLLTLNADVHYYDLMPQRASVVNEAKSHRDKNDLQSAELSFSIADHWQLNEQLSLYCGLRFNEFLHLGPSVYYELNAPDTIAQNYRRGEVVKSYFTLSPQVFLSWKRAKDLSYKFAYSYNAQNIHRGALATLPLPADLWVSSSKMIKPEYAHLLSLGVYKTHSEYDFNAEVYGKLMRNLLLFENNLTGQPALNFEDNFKAGEGYSFGLELLARKNSGRLNGWVAYTLSKSRKRMPTVNAGTWFDAKYDRVHDLSVVANYRLNKRWDFSSSFVLASGNKATVPAGRYVMMGYVMNDYTEVNGFRMPVYHRLDLSVNYHLEPRFFRESILNFSLINAYNRKNTYFFFYQMRGSLEDYELSVKPYQFSLFPVLPSLSWTFKF